MNNDDAIPVSIEGGFVSKLVPLPGITGELLPPAHEFIGVLVMMPDGTLRVRLEE